MPVPVCPSQMRDGSQALKTRSRGFLCGAGSRRVVGGGGGGGLNALEFGKFSEQTVNISSEDWPFMCFNICVLKTTAVAVHTRCQVCCKVAGRGPTLKSHDAVTRRPAAPGGRGRACSWPCWDGMDTGSPGAGPAEALRQDRAAGLVAFLSRRLLVVRLQRHPVAVAASRQEPPSRGSEVQYMYSRVVSQVALSPHCGVSFGKWVSEAARGLEGPGV